MTRNQVKEILDRVLSWPPKRQADGAHVVAVDQATHHSYYPVPSGAGGHPALLERAPIT